MYKKGTSTGSLIAFGLVGGQKDKQGKRVSMSVQEITNLYEKEIPLLFLKSKTWTEWGYSWISPSSWKNSVQEWTDRLSLNPPTHTNGWFYSLFGKKSQIPLLGVPSTPYSRTSFEETLDNMFGNTETNDILFNDCLAGAVAREFNQDINNPDILEIFDSKTNPQLVKEVLLGSSNAPIYFNIPTAIGTKHGEPKNYIDGGLEGRKDKLLEILFR